MIPSLLNHTLATSGLASASDGGGGTVGISGYSSFAPSSHSKMGQQSGKLAVLLVFSESLHLGLAFGKGPQSSTNSKSLPESSSDGTQVERPQNGDNSQLFVGSTVAHLVDAKHIPGKSVIKFIFCKN